MLEEQERIYPRPLKGDKVTAAPPALVPARAPLEGRYVRLEPLDAARHGPALFTAAHEPEAALRIWDFLYDGPWPTLEAYQTDLRGQAAMLERIYYALLPEGADGAQGQASFMDMSARNGVIEIGHIWFGVDLQRTRAATEALYLMLDHAMSDLGYRRMQWRCNALNAKSRGAAARLGFRFEGIFYNHQIFKGMNRDTAWFSILDDEWPEVREILQTWLDPANFDAAGVAKSSLFKAMAARAPGERRIG